MLETVPSAEGAAARPAVKRQVSAETIVAVTRDLIDREGFAAAQARTIAEAAGCSVGTLYNLFGSLDVLLLRVNELTLGDLERSARATLDAAIAAGASPVERIVRLADGYVDFVEAHPHRWSAVYEFRRTPDERMPQWYLERRNGVLAVVEEALAELPGVQCTTARVEIARVLWAALQGIVAFALAGRNGAREFGALRRHIETIIRATSIGLQKVAP